MRILHLSDLHIGKKINDISLLEDQKYVLDQALDIVTKENIDLVIIAGDIFDIPIPSSEALKLYEYFTYSLIFDKKVKIIAISGNHDSNSRIDYEAEMKGYIGYYISGVFDKNLSPITLEDEFGPIDFYPIPYISPYQIRNIYDSKEIITFDDAYKKIIEELPIDKNRRNICISHCFVVNEDPKNEEMIKANMNEEDEYQQMKMVAGLEQVSSKHFEPFIYTALGHIHRSYNINDNMAYCGSLVKTHFEEEKFDKYFLIVDVKENSIDLKRIKVDLLRDMKIIKGNMEDILGKFDSSNSYMKIILEDEEPIAFAMDKLRIKYPNILQLTYSNLYNEKYTSAIDLDRMTFSEVIGEFYKEKTGNNLSDKQKKVVRNVLERIGEKDEDN